LDPQRRRAAPGRRGFVAGLAAAAGCLALTAGAAAATIAVDTELDALAADGHCSLREAITAANTNSQVFAGAGECAAGSGDDDVTLPAGRFTLSRAGAPDDTNANGDLDVLGTAVTIRGAGAAATTVDAARIDRVFDVHAGRTATLERLTVSGGQAANGADGSDVSAGEGASGTGGPGDPGQPGGGIRNLGTLTVRDSTVTDNRAGAGGDGGRGQGGAGATGATGATGGFGQGGFGGGGGDGGGIFTAGSLTLARAAVTGNVAGVAGSGGQGIGGQGGGASSGTGGSGRGAAGGDGGSGGDGGGIASASGATVTIDQSAITANRAGNGGSNGSGQGGLGGATGGNSATGGAGGSGEGGVFEAGRGGFGGGIDAIDPVTVTRSLISANVAGDGGNGGTGTGAQGGGAVGTGGTGGHGGSAFGGDGGDGGLAGGVRATGTFVNVTFTANAAGDAGNGGNGAGAKGGGSVSGPGGDGGNGTPGSGGSGGIVGAILASSGTIQHATVTANVGGAAGAAGQATAGTGGSGSPAGAGGILISASAGFPGAIGAFAGAPTIANTLVLDNGTPSCAPGFTDGGHNFVFPDTTCPGTMANANLGGLADNGGATMTHALLPGSPAIDAVPAGTACPVTDQRGVARTQTGPCDSGAFELAPPGVSTGAAVATGLAATLNGDVMPSGLATSYHFEFGPTTSYGTTTPDTAAGAGVDPIAASANLAGLQPETTFHYRLVASNSVGTSVGEDRTFTSGQTPPDTTPPGTTPAGTTPPDTTPPALLTVSLGPKTFAVNRAGKPETAVTAKAKKGTTFHFELSEPARVLFVVSRQQAGRRVGRRCVEPKRSNRSRSKCARFTVAGRFAVAATSGKNIKKFSGLIGRRALKPGRYRVTLTAKDAAGNSSSPKRVKFRVVRR